MIHRVSQRVMLGLSVATPVAGKYHCTLGELVTYANYRKTSYISRTLVGNQIVDNSDVLGASPVGAAPTTSSFST